MSKWTHRALYAVFVLYIAYFLGLIAAGLTLLTYWALMSFLNEETAKAERRKKAESDKYRDWV